MTNQRWTIVTAFFIAAALGFAAGCDQPAGGSAPAQASKTNPSQKSVPAESPSKATATAPAMDDERFKVPDGPAEKLLEFIDGLANPAPFKSDAEAMAYQGKATSAIGAAADRVLAGAVTEQHAADAIQWKLESQRVMGILGDSQAADAADKFLDQLSQDKRLEVRRAAARVRLRRDLAKWQTQDEQARLASIKKYADAIKANGMTIDDARLLANVSELCSKELFVTSAAGAAPFRDLLPLYRESSDPKIAEQVAHMEGIIRRLELPGKKLELEGKLLDGTPLDWSSYRGKVVLLDFWATDCEECLLETPNQARYLRMYRDKGFEIVGVNLNHDIEEVNRVAKQAGITWPSLFEKHSADERWAHPVADNLSIDGLPQLILLDKEGTVVHMNARGESLGQELRKLLGEPAVLADDGKTVGIPDGSVAEILAHVESQIKSMPQPKSREEQQQNRETVRALLTAAVDKILAGEPTVEQASEAIQMKILTLRLSGLGEAEGERELKQFLQRLEAHSRPAIVAAAAEIQMLRIVNDWDNTSPAERAAVVGKYVELAKESGPTMSHVAVLEKLASMVGLTGDEQLAARAVSGILPLYADRSTPQIAKAAEVLEGTLRRLNLPGTKLEIEGTVMDGTKLDWESYRGKVVLVDFWASWCGPCRAEIPNIVRNLNAYGDKGFAVLGVCVDEDRAAAEEYIKQSGMSWPSLLGTKPGETGFDHPVAVRYGLTGIPLAILVDREGKVVSLLARGPLLEVQLRQMLGEPSAVAGK